MGTMNRTGHRRGLLTIIITIAAIGAALLIARFANEYEDATGYGRYGRPARREDHDPFADLREDYPGWTCSCEFRP